MKLFRCLCRRPVYIAPQLLLGLFLMGCSSMKPAEDPVNPKHPYAFPGQTPATTTVAATEPATTPAAQATAQPTPPPTTPAAPTPTSTSVPVAVMPVIPGSTPPVVPTTPATPVAVAPVAATTPVAPTAPAVPTPTSIAGGKESVESMTVLRSGDVIELSFSDLPAPGLLPVKTELDKDGKITLPYNVIVFAVGKNTRQLEQEIRAEYVPKYFKYLTVTVRPEMRYFHVNGEVKQPNMYAWRGEPTVLRAIGAAGGITDWARREAQVTRVSGEKFTVNLKEAEKNPKKDLPIFPGDYIYVPRKNVWGL